MSGVQRKKLASGHLAHLMALEYLISLVVRKLLPNDDVVEMEIAKIPSIKEEALVIPRFDRSASGKRIHFEEFNQLLGHFSDDKYQGAYEDMGRFIMKTPGSIPAEADRLFRRILAFIRHARLGKVSHRAEGIAGSIVGTIGETMERQFQINWPALVEEAKQRRKAERLTQKQLALLAGVSTPTLSRFENGEKDIQLSSVMVILTTLGMVDQRKLVFSEPRSGTTLIGMLFCSTGMTAKNACCVRLPKRRWTIISMDPFCYVQQTFAELCCKIGFHLPCMSNFTPMHGTHL